MGNLLANLDTLLLVVFAVCALIGAALMLVLREPMRVALALISTMVFLGGIYGLLGVHFIAAFQVLIYVSAVMVFMVYVIMLLDVRDPSFTRRFSTLLLPGAIGGCVRPVTPSMPLGRRWPCQCMLVTSGSRLVTNRRTRSPSTTSIVGPGLWPL